MVNNVRKVGVTLCKKLEPHTCDEFHNQAILENIEQWILSFEAKSALKKSLIVYGDSGVGKTIALKLLLKRMGYFMYFFDSSICRNKKWVQDCLSEVFESKGFFYSKRIIVIDDMDAFTSTNDYGGIAEIVKMLNPLKGKTSVVKTDKILRDSVWRIPVIFVCNNVKSNKFTDLIKECELIHFPNATHEELYKIAKRGKCLKRDVWSFIPHCKGDVRFFLNNIHMYKKNIPEEKETIQHFIYQRLLHTFQNDYNEKVLLLEFYQDPAMFPVLINENIYDNLEGKTLQNVDCIADSISDADVIQNIFYKVNIDMDDMYVYSAFLRPIYFMKRVQCKTVMDISKIRFPVVLGKNAVIHANKQALKGFYKSIINCNLDHFILLRRMLFTLLNDTNTLYQGVQYMINYGITPDALFASLKVRVFSPEEYKNMKSMKYKKMIRMAYTDAL